MKEEAHTSNGVILAKLPRGWSHPNPSRSFGARSSVGGQGARLSLQECQGGLQLNTHSYCILEVQS